MRRLLFLAVVGTFVMANSGCFLNQYSSDPNRRMNELMNHSENLRQVESEWERWWMNDQPSHLTPERVHGGIE